MVPGSNPGGPTITFINMKIAVFGMLPFSQLIKEGFNQLGHVISNNNPDIIFANDPRGYKEAISLKNKNKKTFLILNLLDIPWHMGANITNQTKLLVSTYLIKADAVTVISFKVKKDLAQFLDRKLHVIYNPRKDVCYEENIKKNNMFLFVGRANDPVKRFNLVRETIESIKEENNLNICGSENPGFGNYLGYISDEKLSKLYNSTKYVFLTSMAEGIGLPMIEAAICGAVPITCSDNETAKEFMPDDFMCEPNSKSIIQKIESLNKNYEKNQKLALWYGNKYKYQFSKIEVAKNILSIKNGK